MIVGVGVGVAACRCGWLCGCVPRHMCRVWCHGQLTANTRSFPLKSTSSNGDLTSGANGGGGGSGGHSGLTKLDRRRRSGSGSSGEALEGSTRWHQLKEEALYNIETATAALRDDDGDGGGGIIPSGAIARTVRAAQEETTMPMNVPKLRASLSRGGTRPSANGHLPRAGRRSSESRDHIAPLPGERGLGMPRRQPGLAAMGSLHSTRGGGGGGDAKDGEEAGSNVFSSFVSFAVKDRQLASFRMDKEAAKDAAAHGDSTGVGGGGAPNAKRALQSFKLAAQRVIAQRKYKREAAGTAAAWA